MRKTAVSFLFCFLFLSLVTCFAQQGGPDKADISLAAKGKIWDFARIKEGKVVEHKFILKNDSGKILKIKDVTTSCGCAVSKIKKKTLLSGESTEIEVKFDSKGYSGAVMQYIYVETDNFKEPVLKFTIKADVVKK